MHMAVLSAGNASQWTAWLWIGLLVVWVLMALGGKPTKRRETPREILQHLLPTVAGFMLLFEPMYAWSGLTSSRPVTVTAVWQMGLLLTAVGVAVSIWSRVILGTNWSGVVTLKDDHELIRKGLYRWIRHPIYTGILVAVVGTALVHGTISGWIGFAILCVSFYYKARREERFLSQEFGPRFEEHARHTGMFLPKWT